jgi:predicted regulator of Ras-like GTPase activity (Roadblock/LC7/MglB family)
MPGLPKLIEEDMQVMDAALDTLLRKSEATAALIIDKGGPLINQRGDVSQFDTTTMAALAAGSFCATQAIAERVGETTFNSIYQQGEQRSLLVSNIDENLLLIVVFKAAMSVGVVKYYAVDVINQIAAQLQRALERAPGEGLDLVSLNVLDASAIFRRGNSAPPA